MTTDVEILQQMIEQHLQEMDRFRTQQQRWVAGFFDAMAKGKRYDIPDQSGAGGGEIPEAERPVEQLDGVAWRADPEAERGPAIQDTAGTTGVGEKAVGSEGSSGGG